MLNNISNFNKNTEHDNVSVIGLTATPDDGDEDGIEREAFKSLGYVTYRTSKAKENPPKIHSYQDLSSVELIMKVVEERKYT